MQRALMLALIAPCLAFGTVAARADELVEVAAHQAPPASGATEPTPALLGFLTRPFGPGRFPAVVVLHWCSGFGGHDTAAAAALKSWGYVALAIDSLGDANLCATGGGAGAEATDAFAALRYLAAQNFVASDRIAVMGWSMGALAALEAVDKGPLTALSPAQFRAAVAYYPPCQSVTGDMLAPALILIGARDDWSPPDACRKLAAHESVIGISRSAANSAPIDLVVYPNATHAFDADEPPRHDLGHFMRYDETAASDATKRVKAFLRDKLGDKGVP